VRERFLLFIFHAHECCVTKLVLYVCAIKNCCSLLTFTDDFAPLVMLQDFDKRTFC